MRYRPDLGEVQDDEREQGPRVRGVRRSGPFEIDIGLVDDFDPAQLGERMTVRDFLAVLDSCSGHKDSYDFETWMTIKPIKVRWKNLRLQVATTRSQVMLVIAKQRLLRKVTCTF